MLRSIPIAERNLVDAKLPAVDVGADVSTVVLADSKSSSDEIAYIEIFNAGVASCFYAIGRSCDNVKNFNGWIAAGQAVSVPCRESVSVYSVGNPTKIGLLVLKRVDRIEGQTVQ